jgi:hypothetical protein
MIFKLSLSSVGKNTRQRNSLQSVKNKTLDKELLRRVFYFTESFLRGTRQRAYLSSARKKTLDKIFGTRQREI